MIKKRLEAIVGKKYVLDDEATLDAYSKDLSLNQPRRPSLVVKPKSVEEVQKVVPLYIFFKRVPDLDKTRSGEFRKNVNLKIVGAGKPVDIDMEKLGEYYEIVEKFMVEVKKILEK